MYLCKDFSAKNVSPFFFTVYLCHFKRWPKLQTKVISQSKRRKEKREKKSIC